MGIEVMSTSIRHAIMTVLLVVVFAALAPVFNLSQVSEAQGQMNSNPEQREISITLGNRIIHAVMADTDASRREGLLGWSQITEEKGMLLDFAMEGQYAIHMQGMNFPIDAVWIDSSGLIKMIYNDIAPNSGLIYPSLFPCRYCLEIKSGFCKKYGIKIGQTVQFGSSKTR
jgi:uncharacterized membrane protein (UPF0127 family)